MNPNAGAIAGLVGGIVGSLIGIMGGVIGTYFSIRNTTWPRERAVAIRMATQMWIILILGLGFVGGGSMWLLPPAWRGLSGLVALPISLACVLAIPAWNRKLAEARAEDLKDACVTQG